MRIILNDSCCLIDMRKVGLLRKLLDLPYRIGIVYPLRQFELLDISEGEWRVLEAAGLEIMDLPGELVREAEQTKRQVRGPSVYDCFSFVQAKALGREQCVLLTNDRQLRKLAVAHDLEVHGTLWLLDELLKHQVVTQPEYRAALQAWNDDVTVHLPQAEVAKRLSDE